ncbi:TetR/AcrR family transcriptional regulator [Pseudonocardia humida]|uniref:TetR/AcrR family transcriptional regulator n=1 Tax=Pseudonocardia humida TaxID=2800819 RepID=A0ABT0ZTF6_9PSEU|nr:TetR/AcrR family transcriptional regulator [Pseudonocardia humida]MCO1653998.1 TetR/AcrR family transcriptional regulator [Pseudonocardia humida]
MSRLSRAQTQERNRARVVAAARAEFAERGFRDAKIDVIAERAELTRGAVYSNFPGKRALYLTVLAEDAERAAELPDLEPGRTVRSALAAFATAWLADLPLATERGSGPAPLGADLLPEVLTDAAVRIPFAQLTRLQAVVLGVALERLRPAPDGRLVRVAESALTTLHGASVLAAAAPGFVEPFDVVAGCGRLADVDLRDSWDPPHLPYVPAARPVDEPWDPPAVLDSLSGEPVRLTGDGVVTVLGLHRVGAVEEAVRAAPTADVTAVLVSGEPAELLPLARLVVADLRRCLRPAVPEGAWPRLRIVLDARGAVAAATGTSAVSDATEAAVRIAGGRVVARADGHGAGHAAAAR